MSNMRGARAKVIRIVTLFIILEGVVSTTVLDTMARKKLRTLKSIENMDSQSKNSTESTGDHEQHTILKNSETDVGPGERTFGLLTMNSDDPNIPGNVAVGSSNQQSGGINSLISSGSPISTVGSSIILIKGGLLKGLTGLKAIILPPLFLGAIIAFLISGAAFFTCRIFDCESYLSNLRNFGSNNPFSSQNTGGSFGQNGFSNPQFNRKYYDYDTAYSSFQASQPATAVYKSLADAYNKYEPNRDNLITS